MWKFDWASVAQVKAFVGGAPLPAPVCKKVDMNVHAPPGMCTQSSTWHRFTMPTRSHKHVPKARATAGAGDVSRSGTGHGGSRTSKHSSFSPQLPDNAGFMASPRPSVQERDSFSVPFSESDAKAKPGTSEPKMKAPSAVGAVCDGGVELGIGWGFDTEEWNGQNLRRRLKSSAWKLPDGALISEREKVDTSTFSSLFADCKQAGLEERKVSLKEQKHSAKKENALVFKLVRKHDEMKLALEEESLGKRDALQSVNNASQDIGMRETKFFAIEKSGLGFTPYIAAEELESGVLGTAKNMPEMCNEFVVKAEADSEQLVITPDDFMLNQAEISWENAVDAARNLHLRKKSGKGQSKGRQPVKNEKFTTTTRRLSKDDSISLLDRATDAQPVKGIVRILENDKKVIWKGLQWVSDVAVSGMQAAVESLSPLKHEKNPLVVPETTSARPMPYYAGLSGKELLAADIQALKEYAGMVQKWCSLCFVPLQETYDAEEVARYFNLRPHLLLFRLFEVSTAFGYVALQLMAERATLSSKGAAMVKEDDKEKLSEKGAEIMKQTLLRLGPAFVKVAQSLSARPDLIGPATAKIFSELQDRLPPFPTEDAFAILEEELGKPVNEVFSYLSSEPVAAASFGQVYKGRTFPGDEVAVKVQRPGLLFSVARDVHILRLGLAFVRKVAKINSDISLLADELGRGLYGELNYNLEAANAREFQDAHAHLEYVVVPRILTPLTTRRVLTMEWIHGDRLGDLKLIADGHLTNGQLDRSQAKLHLISMVNKGVQASIIQLLETGVLHADPHPGNLLFTTDGHLGYLDFGLLCHMEKKHQAAMFASIAHLINGEWQCLANDLADMGILKPTTNRFELQWALEDAFGKGPDAVVKNGMSDFRFDQVAGKLWKVALKFRFRLPPYYTLVLRSLSSLEGVALTVDPNFKIFASAYPYVVSRLLTDKSTSTRQVLHSLVLDTKGEFRWDRIASFIALSKEATAAGKRAAAAASDISDKSREGQAVVLPELTSTILKLVLSSEGHAIRRVLLAADTRGLARVFVSEKAGPLRQKVAEMAANLFYEYFEDTMGIDPETSQSMAPPKAASVKAAEGSARAVESGNKEHSMVALLKNRRLQFLMGALLGRLTGSPLLMLRVGWAFTTMICLATALALHKAAVAISYQYLKKRTSVKQRVENERFPGNWSRYRSLA